MSKNDTLERDIRSALVQVLDPQGGGDIVSRGLVGEVEVEGDEATIVLSLDRPRDAAERAELEDRVRAAVEAVPGVASCLVDVRTTEPTARQAHAHQGRSGEHRPAPRPEPLPGVKKIIAVASGKGGVGKSTVALNLALALSARGLKVGLLDADMHGPSFPILLGLGGVQPRAEHGRVEPIQASGLSVMSLGFLLDPDQPVIWRGPMITGAIRQLLQDVAWDGLDVLVVDLPPGTGDAQLTLVQTAPVDQALVVTTPSDLALSDARRGLLMFRQVGVPVLGIVENMSYFLCPHCGERSDVFGAGGGRRTAEGLGIPFLGEIPLDIGVSRGNDQGRPIFLAEPEGASAQVFAELAAKAAGSLGFPTNGAQRGESAATPPARKGLLSGLFGGKD